MGLQLKELNKLIAVLERDHLIRMYAFLAFPIKSFGIDT
jgi:hypothetical protein